MAFWRLDGVREKYSKVGKGYNYLSLVYMLGLASGVRYGVRPLVKCMRNGSTSYGDMHLVWKWIIPHIDSKLTQTMSTLHNDTIIEY